MAPRGPRLRLCARELVWSRMAPPVLVLVLVAASAFGVRSAGAIENKCGACVAVQHELMDILLEERPKSNLDLRNRLNTQGKREGKVIDYKDSELRILDILEGLCEKLKKYSLMTPGKDKKRIWVHGQKQSTGRLKLIAEEQGKELKRWCDRMLELHEDEMAEMIRGEVVHAYKDVPIVLCRNITGSCRDEDAYLKEVQRVAPHLPVPSAGKGVPGIQVTSAPGPAGADDDLDTSGSGGGSAGADQGQGETPDEPARVEL